MEQHSDSTSWHQRDHPFVCELAVTRVTSHVFKIPARVGSARETFRRQLCCGVAIRGRRSDETGDPSSCQVQHREGALEASRTCRDATKWRNCRTSLFARRKKAHLPKLKGFAKDGHPKRFNEALSENLVSFKTAPVVDGYGIYQHLMGYWATIMEYECYLAINGLRLW